MPQRLTIFEQIRHAGDGGAEYWSARELAKALGYRDYQHFPKIIAKAKEACESSNYPVEDHFRGVAEMVEIGSGAQREVEDVHLSRYACYLVVQNADPRKVAVARGQTYFAVRTRHDELTEDEAARLTDDELRVRLRHQVANDNTGLASAAFDAGVVTSRDFAIFQDHGYRGLYGGETARDIAARKGVKPGQILDHMGRSELAANWFRITQTRDRIEREGITDKERAGAAHEEVGKVVRQAIEDLGGTLPEQLPTLDRSVQQVERDLARQAHLEEEDRAGLWAQLPPADDTAR